MARRTCRRPPGAPRSARQVGVVDDQIGEARRRELMIWCSMSVRPPAASRGFGVWSVSGRMRLPRPAARIMAFMEGWVMVRAAPGTGTYQNRGAALAPRRGAQVLPGHALPDLAGPRARLQTLAPRSWALVQRRHRASVPMPSRSPGPEQTQKPRADAVSSRAVRLFEGHS
jgi:hypothetical protein